MTDLNNSELNDAELEVVVGGLDCKTQGALSDFYAGLSKCMESIGNARLANYFIGVSYGINQVPCG